MKNLFHIGMIAVVLLATMASSPAAHQATKGKAKAKSTTAGIPTKNATKATKTPHAVSGSGAKKATPMRAISKRAKPMSKTVKKPTQTNGAKGVIKAKG